jgi:hypothetical protein
MKRMDKILAAVDAEEELPGNPPVWLVSMIARSDVNGVIDAMRKAVIETKKGIKNRIFKLLDEEPEVWVIVQDTDVTHGHGDSGIEPMLAHNHYNPNDVFPAFTSVEAATEFKNGLTYKSMMRVQRLELKES